MPDAITAAGWAVGGVIVALLIICFLVRDGKRELRRRRRMRAQELERMYREKMRNR